MKNPQKDVSGINTNPYISLKEYAGTENKANLRQKPGNNNYITNKYIKREKRCK